MMRRNRDMPIDRSSAAAISSRNLEIALFAAREMPKLIMTETANIPHLGGFGNRDFLRPAGLKA